MFGILNLYKPSGITSRDAVNRVQRVLRPIKVGHAGTLDPLAEGVLLVPVGAASRLVPYLHELPKRYEAVFRLGVSSPSDDSETEIRIHEELPVPTLAAIEQAASAMRGEVMQRPPAYSAIKVGGRRAYELVRAGQQVALDPRPVTIDSVEIRRYEFPELEISIDCGSGTYVRSIGRDLAEAVGSRAIMTALVRTAIGPFRIEDALEVDGLSRAAIDSALVPAALAVEQMPSIELSAADIEEIRHGRTIAIGEGQAAAETAALDEAGRLRAILVPRSGRWQPHRVFPDP